MPPLPLSPLRMHADYQRRIPRLEDSFTDCSYLFLKFKEHLKSTGHAAIVALNFSYQVFHTRAELRGYLAAARAALAPAGVAILDVFGGWESQQVIVERRRMRGGVTYVWEHESFDPITHRMRCAIHFELAGGRRIRGAFRYDWRLWTIPELTELLGEAGFQEVEVLWDVAPAGAERYVPRRAAKNQPGWIAYLVGRRSASPARRPAGRKGARSARDG